MSNKITIGKITTKPEHDPCVNIQGVVSRTFLKLDPRNRTVWVTQEYRDNSTLMDEWNHLVTTWPVHSHPTQKVMRQWIVDNIDLLRDICDGFERHWNGNNWVGRYSEEARAAYRIIEFAFDDDGGPINRLR